jgi:hypothetical protein
MGTDGESGLLLWERVRYAGVVRQRGQPEGETFI